LAIVMTEENEMKKMTLSGVIGNDENNVIWLKIMCVKIMSMVMAKWKPVNGVMWNEMNGIR
jgi:hypothetical protein